MQKPRIRMIGLVLALLITAGLATSAMAANPGLKSGTARNGIIAGQQYAQSALKAVSELTGLSVTDIRAQRQEGQSLATIAASKGISEQAVIDKVMSERKTALAQLKAEGKITDTQYDSCIADMQSRIKANIERTTIGPAKANAGFNKGKGLGSQRQLGQSGNKWGHGERGANNNRVNCPYNLPRSN